MSDGGPAFPIWETLRDDDGEFTVQHNGMTLRDYFAAQITPGLLTMHCNAVVSGNAENSREQLFKLARGAYDMADVLLEVRKE